MTCAQISNSNPSSSSSSSLSSTSPPPQSAPNMNSDASQHSSYDISPSPTSSASDQDSSLDAFLSTHSRVVRLSNLPSNASVFLSSIFLSSSCFRPIPQSLWALRGDDIPLGVWAVFGSHEEACATLALSASTMFIAPALESDLEPFHKLKRFQLKLPSTAAINQLPSTPQQPGPLPHRPEMLQLSAARPQVPVLVSQDPTASRINFPISSNPPNPRTNFRLGDWICSSPNCAAHNFGRNLACIGCGCARTVNSPTSPSYQHSLASPTRPPPSPRFATSPNVPNFANVLPAVRPSNVYPSAPPAPSPVPVNMPAVLSQSKSGHPLLTPSGRAFAVGGRVQNVSIDPLSPCIMYWPDNEALPEQGQIRPNGLVGMPQPPILNTGNRGPIAHQPGDWICQKCNYLNWRRRKVCQTCFPYAEGNGDSISAAVQAERIALLTSVLAQTQLSSPHPPRHPAIAPLRSQVLRSHSVTPPQVRRPFIDISPPQSRGPGGVVHRSQSQLELGSQYKVHTEMPSVRPIYQTSVHRRPSPVYSTPPPSHPQLSVSQDQQLAHRLQLQLQLQQQQQQLQLHAPAPAPLLPSFLQDIVHSPALSPSSTSSADLSFDEYDESLASPSRTSATSRSRQTSGDSTTMKLSNIWKMDGEESKTMSAFALPNTIIGGSRKSSLEKLRE